MRKGYRITFWLVGSGLLLILAIGFLSVMYLGSKAAAPMAKNMEMERESPKIARRVENIFEDVDHALGQMRFGNAAFNAPTAMKLSDTASIQLLLSLVTPIEELKGMVEGHGIKEGVRIKVSNRMEARLTGANFSITAVTPEAQAVSNNTTTEWKWEIKPISKGVQNLHLTLSALIDVDGSTTPRSIRTFDKTIVVEVTWRQKVSQFIEKNWQWLWAVMLAPLGGWIWKRRKVSTSNKILNNS